MMRIKCDESTTIQSIAGGDRLYSSPDFSGPALSGNIAELALKNGTILYAAATTPRGTPPPKGAPPTTATSSATGNSPFSISTPPSTTADYFEPFPEKSKKGHEKMLQWARRNSRRKGQNSFDSLSKITSNLHKVEVEEPTKRNTKRIMMCEVCAGRFSHGGSKGRCALLFGRLLEENERAMGGEKRKDQFAAVDCVYEPSSSGDDFYDPSGIDLAEDYGEGKGELARVLELADSLEIVPVGWIYAYEQNEARAKAKLPMMARDVLTASRLQSNFMRRARGSSACAGARTTTASSMAEKAAKEFVTIAVNSETSSSEPFQVSDQGVQMVFEGVVCGGDVNAISDELVLKTSAPVIVDGVEKEEVDSDLFLVPTGILGGKGGKFVGLSIKGGGKKFALKKKERMFLKKLIAADGTSDEQVLDFLRDFRVLFFFWDKLDKKGKTKIIKSVKKKRGELGEEFRDKLAALCSKKH